MLLSVNHILSSQKIVLADTSSSRRQVLRDLGLKFQVVPSTYKSPKPCRDYNSLSEFVIELATGRAQEVFARLSETEFEPDIVVGAASAVLLNSRVFLEAGTPKAAINMLKVLNGKTHVVVVGVAIKTPNTLDRFSEKSSVTLVPMTETEIKTYVNTGEPLNHLGAMSYSGQGLAFISRIEGEYSTLMGIPARNFCTQLSKSSLFRSEFLQLSRALGPSNAEALLQSKAQKSIQPINKSKQIKNFLTLIKRSDDKSSVKGEESVSLPPSQIPVLARNKGRRLQIVKTDLAPAPSKSPSPPKMKKNPGKPRRAASVSPERPPKAALRKNRSSTATTGCRLCRGAV